MFIDVKVEQILEQNIEIPLLVLVSPNYEERSCALAEKIEKEAGKSERKVLFELISFRNSKNNDMLLEGLKNKYCKRVCDALQLDVSTAIHWFAFPEDFSVKRMNAYLNNIITENIENDKIDILIDVSSIPRSVVFVICEAIWKIIHEKTARIRKVYFAYTSPKYYSEVRYAQDIGMLYGYFSGMPLNENSHKTVNSIIFPSRSGHEGKLLCDNLSQICSDQRQIVFFPIEKDDYLQSLSLMRANQTLLSHEDYFHLYYCSICDAAIGLNTYLMRQKDSLVKVIENNREVDIGKQFYLAGTFGAKIFIAISYFELMLMKASLPNLVDIEMCYAKGFQYTSTYSRGIGSISILEWDEVPMRKRVKIKICDVRTAEVAKLCAEEGVDFIGIHQIYGMISNDKLKEIQKIKNVSGDMKLVLVTKEENLDILTQICSCFEWDYVQLHFSHTPEFVDELKERLQNIGKSIGIISMFGAENFDVDKITALSDKVDYFLFDSSERGGSGKTASDEALKKIAQANLKKEFFLAGGLNPDNVLGKISMVQPYAVDVQSGVEFSEEEWKKQKNPGKIKRFVRNIVNGR